MPIKYTSKTGNILIGSQYAHGFRCTFFFRIAEIHSKNCLGPNIFQFDSRNPNQNTTISIPGSSKDCVYTLLSYSTVTPPTLVLTRLSTVSNLNTTFFGGIDPHYPLFSFNNDTASTWMNINLRGPFNSFILPDDNGATIEFFNSYCKLFLYNIKYNLAIDYTNFPSTTGTVRGIVYSNSYSDPTALLYSNETKLSLVSRSDMSDIVFTCKFFDLGPNDRVYVENTP